MYHKIAEELQSLLRGKKLTLATAESCTGGAIAATLTAIPDASHHFLGAVVAYSNEMKQDLLKVSSTLLEKQGAVSPDVAVAMWKGILSVTHADYAIAVTGIAGPTGGTSKKPVGTVWAAVGKRGKEPEVWNVDASGSRTEIIDQTVDAVLVALRNMI